LKISPLLRDSILKKHGRKKLNEHHGYIKIMPFADAEAGIKW